MFTGTLDKLTGNFEETIKPHMQRIADALYLVAGIALMILLALVTRLCPQYSRDQLRKNELPRPGPLQPRSR